MSQDQAQGHLKAVGALTVTLGALELLAALGLVAAVAAFFRAAGGWIEDRSWLVVLTGFLVLFLVAAGGLSLAGGIALLKRRRWGTWTAYMQAVVSLLNFPLGTAYAVYVFWALTRSEVRALLR